MYGTGPQWTVSGPGSCDISFNYLENQQGVNVLSGPVFDYDAGAVCNILTDRDGSAIP